MVINSLISVNALVPQLYYKPHKTLTEK